MFKIIKIIHSIIITFFIINGNILNALIFPNETIPNYPVIWDFRIEKEKFNYYLDEGERAMLICPLSNQFRASEMYLWKKLTKENGYKIIYSEIKKELAMFPDIEAAYAWLATQDSPDKDEISQFLEKQPMNQKIFVPYRRLILIIERPMNESF